MRTLIATFDSNDDYNQQKQIIKIAECCENADVLVVDNYDMLDECIKVLPVNRYNELVILHEDNLQIDDFEKAAKAEYKNLFESIEILPEQFNRNHLQENYYALDQKGNIILTKQYNSIGNGTIEMALKDPNVAGIYIDSSSEQNLQKDLQNLIPDQANEQGLQGIQQKYKTIAQSAANEGVQLREAKIFWKKDSEPVKTGLAQGQQQQQEGGSGEVDPENVAPPDNQGIATYLVYPFNAPVLGTVPLINASVAQLKSAKGLTYCPPDKKSHWCSRCGNIARRFKGFKQLSDFCVVNFTGCLALFQRCISQGAKRIKILAGDPKDVQRITDELKIINQQLGSNDPQNPIVFVEPFTGGQADSAKSETAYKLGLQIYKALEQKQLKLNKENIEKANEWLGNEQNKENLEHNPLFAKRKFLVDCLGLIKMLEQISMQKEPVSSDKWIKFRDRAWGTLGFGESIKRATENVDNLGGGLFIDAIKIGVDAARTALEKDNKEQEDDGNATIEQLLVTHPDWEKFAELFDDPGVFQSIPSEDGKVDEVKIGEVESSKITGDKNLGSSGAESGTGTEGTT